ncbi:hypothetical protein GF323_07080 [Candidatus Woesearchaeota archaeon]|nr:hypothetical protein [Candidatus Woesearchaeota archaeon]
MERYDMKKLEDAVRTYREIFKKIKGKTVLVVLDISQAKAFYSLAPLSKAIHELNADMNVAVIKKQSPNLNVLKDVWSCHTSLKHGLRNRHTKALNDFIALADKKCENNIRKIFEPPEIYLNASKNSFEGSFSLPYSVSWYKDYRKKDLENTAKIIWKQVFNIRKNEKIAIGFELLRKKSDMGLPIQDYLDSFHISYAMMSAVKDHEISMSASTPRKSQLADPERISELKTTLLGCEICKENSAAVFRKFKILSSLLKINRLGIPGAVFGIRGKGYSGRHYFGEYIGYPSKNKKTRWLSPDQMLYKLDYYPQTALDDTPPKSRVGFTETLPIDTFIKTGSIDWLKMQKKDQKIVDIICKSQYIMVEGKKFGKYRTRLKVGIVSPGEKRRRFRGSDVETRNLINPYFRKKGILAGTMANIPGGEAFGTPEYVRGQFIGDVVISLDQSYVLSAKNPIIVNCRGNNYTVIKGPKNIITKFKEKKKDAWEKLLKQEKARSLPKKVIDINKKNFNNIGEFAINTNPEAELCNYLIVNEKIANMIHIALGSGFDADRATYYHTDIVIDSPRQQLDIYGVSRNGEKYWIHKKGKFVV